MAQKKRPYDFFIRVAELNTMVLKMKSGQMKHKEAELVDAEILISELKQKDLFCEEAILVGKTPAAAISPKSNKTLSVNTGDYTTLDDPVEGRPILISGGGFETNRKKH